MTASDPPKEPPKDKLLEEIQVNEKIINEEYKIWKKQSPFLYDTLICKALEWPTLTVQWLPGPVGPTSEAFTTYELLLGTHTSKNDQDYIQYASVDLPTAKFDASVDAKSAVKNKIDITSKINHEGEVNKLAYCPQDPKTLASLAISGQVLIFNRDQAGPEGSSTTNGSGSGSTCDPLLRLVHHTSESWGLSWSPFYKGQLVSGSEDTTIALWDINRAPSAKKIDPVSVVRSHTSLVNDVEYSAKLPYMFGSASDDLSLKFFDTRDLSVGPAIDIEAAHNEPINSLAFNPFREHIVASASSDNSVGVWDLRKPQKMIYQLNGHSSDVTTVKWSPLDESVIASSSQDRRVNVWDMSMIGVETSNEQEGPSELVFIHGGHTNRIMDFAWHPTIPWTLCSASEDNVVEVWTISSAIVDHEEEEEEEEEDAA